MWRVVSGLLVLHCLLTFIDSIVVGSSDLYATKLTAAVDEVNTTITVQSTSGWRLADYMWVGDEKIRYNGRTATTFTNCLRGFDGTDAIAHPIGQRVYSRASDAVRASAGFNVLNIGASAGVINMMTVPVRFALVALPQLVAWNYSFLKEEGMPQFVRLILIAFSGGFVLYILIQIAAAIGGVAQGILRRY